MDLLHTPLAALHRSLGGRMVPFAGYEMPVQFAGVMEEHLACRASAAMFDVSHMGQAMLDGQEAAGFLETLLPGDVRGLRPGRQRYSFLTNEQGGIEDDLMVSCLAADRYFLVVNAGRKQQDFASLGAGLPAGVRLKVLEDRALLAVQGPGVAGLLPELAAMAFMSVAETEVAGVCCIVCRSGYTGEDGFEISCAAVAAEGLARHLIGLGCTPAGLGARDSLRLEAGLCLHGNDIDAATNPVEAALGWAIGKRRRAAGGYPGAAVIDAALQGGPARLRVGLRPQSRAPARAGTAILSETGERIGQVTSGGYSPSLGAPVAMGYVPAAFAEPGTPVLLCVRDRRLPARIAALPFVPHRYAR